MNLDVLISQNARALGRAYTPKSALLEAIREFPYRGFVEVAVTGSQPLIMFSNYDDIVAQHFLFHGPDSFESYSLMLWAHFAARANVVFDVGAFTGVYSLVAARSSPSARILAFEPSLNTFARLVTNVLANDLGERIGTLKVALGDADGALTLKHPAGIHCLGSQESLVDGRHESIWFEEEVRVFAGDRLGDHYQANPRDFIIEVDPTRVDLIKIDVEGFEPQVLQGMRDLVARDRPVLLIECLGVEEFERVRTLLAPLGYQYRFIDDAAHELHDDIQRFSRDPLNVLFVNQDLDLEQLSVNPGQHDRPQAGDMTPERMEAALRERDDALTALAKERERNNTLRLHLDQLGEPEPPHYPLEADPNSPPLRYVVADEINNRLKKTLKPLHNGLKRLFSTLG